MEKRQGVLCACDCCTVYMWYNESTWYTSLCRGLSTCESTLKVEVGEGGGVQETLLVAVKLSSHLLFTWMQLLFTCLFVFFSSYSSTFVMRYHFSVSNSSPKTFKVVSVCSDWWVGKPSSHEKREPKKLNKQQQIAPPFKVFVRKLRSISPPSR